MYSKEISIIGFSNLTGIDPDTFYNWGNKECMVNEKAFEIYKKLKRTHEESLGNMLASGKNPVGILGILNHRFGWNTANTIEVKPAISKQTPQEIAKQYGVNVEQIAQKEIEIDLPPTDKN